MKCGRSLLSRPIGEHLIGRNRHRADLLRVAGVFTDLVVGQGGLVQELVLHCLTAMVFVVSTSVGCSLSATTPMPTTVLPAPQGSTTTPLPPLRRAIRVESMHGVALVLA